MKKKMKKSEQKTADCDNLYDMIEMLHSRIEEIEKQHTELIREMAKLNTQIGDFYDEVFVDNSHL